MRSIILVLASAFVLAGCSMMPFGGSDAEKPAPAAPGAVPLAVTTTASADLYQIKDADRGMVRRVKVLLNGRTIDTLTMSKGRTEATSHCCTADGCETIELAKSKTEPVKACTAFKLVCDVKGACKEDAPPKSGSKI